MFSVKEVLLLVAVQQNNTALKELVKPKKSLDKEQLELTDEECATRMLSKENQKALGLKSPKLSKALMKLGLPEKVVSQALASANISEIPRISAEVEDLLEMGDSIHYKSCQRTGGQLRTVEELLPFLGTDLWLYVVGERQSLNGSGFKARRLLRMMYHDPQCTKQAGVYLEKGYGDLSLLPDEEVQQFFDLPLFGEEGCKKQEVSLFCPSAEYGYNDTLRRGVEQFFYRPVECKTSKNIVVLAYHARPKSAFAYVCSLAENRYNPQNGKFSTPPLERGWRGFITPKQRTLIQAWIEVFGYPQQRFDERGEVAVSSVIGDLKLTVAQKGKDYGFCYRKLLVDFPVKFLSASPEKIEVIQDLPELLFWKPLSVFERWIKKEGEVTAEELSLVEFWVDSFGYPAEGEYFTSHYKKLNITHQGYTFCLFLYNGERSIVIESDGVRREEYLFTHSLYYGKHEVWYTEPKLGFWRAISLDLGKATFDCCNLLGFCPVEVGETFSYGEYKLFIVLNSAREYSLTVSVPNKRFPETLLEVKEDFLRVNYDLPELGFLKAVTLEQEFYGKTYYTEARTVQRDCPELGFLKAVPIINYQVNDSLWVTGPLPTK